jgi:flagellin-like hook-associated protein FlgL
MKRLYILSAYRRAADCDYTSLRKVAHSKGEVLGTVIQADAALRGILAALRAMKAVCVSCADRHTGPEKRAEYQAELEALKKEISRLSQTVNGMEFLSLDASRVAGPDSLRTLDASIRQVSEFRESLISSEEEEKLSSWMDSLLPDRAGEK